MSVTVDIVDPRVDPEPSGWTEFRHRLRLQPVWDYRLLRLESWMSRNPPVLAVVRDGRTVVGGLVAMVCRGWNARTFGALGGGRLRPRWAEVYLPLLSGYPACVLDGDADARRLAVRAFERALVRHSGPGLLGVLYRAMTKDLAEAMSGPARVLREIDPTAVLGGVDDERSWRATVDPQTLRELDAVAADRDIVADSAAGRDDLDPHALAVVLNAHRARQDDRAWAGGQRARFGGLHMDTRSPIAAAYLDELVRRRDVITTTYSDRDGTLLGFNTMIDHPVSSAVHHWAALPRSAGGRAGLYLDAYARCVRRVAETGSAELTAGRAILDRKSALGFGIRDLYTVAAARPVLGR